MPSPFAGWPTGSVVLNWSVSMNSSLSNSTLFVPRLMSLNPAALGGLLNVGFTERYGVVTNALNPGPAAVSVYWLSSW